MAPGNKCTGPSKKACPWVQLSAATPCQQTVAAFASALLRFVDVSLDLPSLPLHVIGSTKQRGRTASLSFATA